MSTANKSDVGKWCKLYLMAALRTNATELAATFYCRAPGQLALLSLAAVIDF